jgi:hypothetical protein
LRACRTSVRMLQQGTDLGTNQPVEAVGYVHCLSRWQLAAGDHIRQRIALCSTKLGLLQGSHSTMLDICSRCDAADLQNFGHKAKAPAGTYYAGPKPSLCCHLGCQQRCSSGRAHRLRQQW